MTVKTEIVWNKIDENTDENTGFVFLACKNFDGSCGVCEGYRRDNVWYTVESNPIDTSISVPYAWTFLKAPSVESFN